MAVGQDSADASTGPYRVMIVDDSAVIRGLLTRALESDPEISIVASVQNGKIALSTLERQKVDVVVLDIEMPVMDGMTALPLIIKANPGVKVIMASTLTLKNAEISMQALQAGAADYIPKPTSTGAISTAGDFKRELTEKVKALGLAARGRSPVAASAAAPAARASTGNVVAKPAAAKKPIALRAMPTTVPDIIAIGSSTGGPQALFEVIKSIAGQVTQPILITQHMPATFTKLLAEHISRVSGMTCSEATDGEAIVGGQVYVAPGDFHMVLEDSGGKKIIRLTQEPPENFCRPSVDPMLRSLSEIYGPRLLVLILTGMGSDGQRGSEVVTAAGGAVIAQDEATSVVWGMPGAVASNGLCSAVLPLKEIGPQLLKLVMRSAA
ncbi:chemotaxis response regulator protein-glutamate methylesterase [Pelagibius sp. Alg239-R121]|uniref:protein-glutamate methylesterase/protein-glutamine glutaminase n=1 Tax=Pelagibius sp. Alg239-R121 TaxID=2993448 RepID=UPI002AC3133E|nr:chemotaxis response regulator protein-glutamate methylesterase [Pelagibius sp. Alg239-R121]